MIGFFCTLAYSVLAEDQRSIVTVALTIALMELMELMYIVVRWLEF